MLPKHSASPDRYSILKEFARENRKNMTLAERLLWKELRGSNLECKFLRQYIIGDYIVDFVSRECSLIIEVDGAYHAERIQQHDDAVRQHNLERNGYRVIRFSNEEIYNNIDHVVAQIQKTLP